MGLEEDKIRRAEVDDEMAKRRDVDERQRERRMEASNQRRIQMIRGLRHGEDIIASLLSIHRKNVFISEKINEMQALVGALNYNKCKIEAWTKMGETLEVGICDGKLLVSDKAPAQFCPNGWTLEISDVSLKLKMLAVRHFPLLTAAINYELTMINNELTEAENVKIG